MKESSLDVGVCSDLVRFCIAVRDVSNMLAYLLVFNRLQHASRLFFIGFHKSRTPSVIGAVARMYSRCAQNPSPIHGIPNIDVVYELFYRNLVLEDRQYILGCAVFSGLVQSIWTHWHR